MAIVNGTDSPETIDNDDGVTIGDDLISGFGGDDTIFGLGGNDIIKGGEGNDIIRVAAAPIPSTAAPTSTQRATPTPIRP